MARKLSALVGSLAVLAAATAASAGPTAQGTPGVVMASRADPKAGRAFVGSVLVLPAAARRGLVSADARCVGTVLGRTVPGRVTRVPANEPLPAALLCTYSIPRNRVGWTFRARMEIDLQRQLRGGDLEVTTDEGTTTRWIVQP